MSVSTGDIRRTLEAIDSLVLYRMVFEDPILGDFKRVLESCLYDDTVSKGLFYGVLEKLISQENSCDSADIDIFKNHLLNTVLATENSFSLFSEKNPYQNIEDLLVRAVERDLHLLKIVYDFDLKQLEGFITVLDTKHNSYPPLGNLIMKQKVNLPYPEYYFQKRASLKGALIYSTNWSENVRDFYNYYRETGSGKFARYWAFKWSSYRDSQWLQGIANPDPVKMDNLVGYEEQKKEVLRNTRQFVCNTGANNMLLYGDRGTGKSSTVKSLVHIFGAEGLRIIEISKHDLLSLHKLVAEVQGRAQKFIIFIDDLSFEEDETEYKDLKALLEGSIASPPDNVLVYATSNRRNLVREYFNDRESDEVGRQDTYQEKLSLADRFGIKLVYSAPDKEEYLRTVDDMAEKSGIKINKNELHELALRWVLWHNARSGRTAHQFINDLKGQMNQEE